MSVSGGLVILPNILQNSNDVTLELLFWTTAFFMALMFEQVNTFFL